MSLIDRRGLIASAGAAICAPAAAVSAQRPSADRLYKLFDAFMAADLDASPEEATSLGLDTGARAGEKARLDSRSLVAIAAERRRIRRELGDMLDLDPASLSGMDRVNYDVVLFTLKSTHQANSRYDYGPGAAILPYVGAGAPYVLSPLTGAYSSVPDFLDGQHRVETKADADAYLSRLEAFGLAMDQEIEVVRHDAAHGCAPPDFALARMLGQMAALRSAAAQDCGLVTSLARRAKARGVAGDYAADATKIVTETVYPALERQIAFAEDLQARATHDAGVWKFRRGDEYYTDSLIAWTTSPLSPAEIHRLALDAVADRTARIDTIMRRQGMTAGSAAERLRAMFSDPKFRYPNTDAGKQQLLTDLNGKLQALRAKAPQYFGVLPRADVVVKPVPTYMEASRPSGYYQPPSLDDGRPGAFYINLRNTAETPSWLLPTHLYHESIPGHHLKGGIYQEARLPTIRKTALYSAYMEGWSLYAEHLADEMGMYDDDPFGRIGYLHSELRAAVAMVVDTGLHMLRWSREQAIAYFIGALGDPASSAATEVERYCIWPGQVCAYMLDKLAILSQREKAKAALGPRFDIRQFHDAILLCGPVPQAVLAAVVDGYIRAKSVRGARAASLRF
jgi:uncharacterized protein (DUF885 family)